MSYNPSAEADGNLLNTLSSALADGVKIMSNLGL